MCNAVFTAHTQPWLGSKIPFPSFLFHMTFCAIHVHHAALCCRLLKVSDDAHPRQTSCIARVALEHVQWSVAIHTEEQIGLFGLIFSWGRGGPSTRQQVTRFNLTYTQTKVWAAWGTSVLPREKITWYGLLCDIARKVIRLAVDIKRAAPWD